MSMSAIPVSRIAAAWVAAVIILVICTIALAVFGGGGSPATVMASAYSRSAIGYAGIADMMHRLGARVVKSRKDSVAQLDPAGVLIVAEPAQSVPAQQMSTLMNAHTVLLVLPKWTGRQSPAHPAWIEGAELVSTNVPRAAAQIANVEIVRVPRVTYWPRNEIGRTPVISEGGIQLIRSSRLRPVIGNENGMLVGELRTGARRLWILADPDPLHNHGIADPDNAVFAVALINALRGADGNVVFDEVVHGFETRTRTGSPLRLLFEFPFVLATIQAVIAVALLLWATMRRFGAPLSPPVELKSGKRSLIEATANLLDFARHRPMMIQRYVHETLQDVARQLHAPASLSEAGLIEWLRRTARVRDAQIDCGAVVRKTDELVAAGRGASAQLAVQARDIFRWKREVIDGGSGYSRIDRGDPQRGGQGGRRTG